MRFYLTFGFLGFKVVNKREINLFKSSKDFGLSNFIWLTEAEFLQCFFKLIVSTKLVIFI